jgi:signal transduction histidine kinase/ActR/RegA family two-component response regulator
MRHRDGHLLDVEIASHPLVLDGKPVLFASARGIAERKAAELAVRQLNAELEQRVQQRTAELEAANAGLAQARDVAEAASRAKSTFLATMSHELRTPMNAILGMTALARTRASDPRQIGHLGKVNVAAQHLLAIITDILDISRIEANKLQLQESDFNLAQTLQSVDALIRIQADAKHIDLVVELAPVLRAVQLRGDEQRLKQILVNLAGNAVKFTDAGKVTIAVSLDQDHGEQVELRFEVQDTGSGIDPADQPRIFQAFEQADGSYTRKHGGTGLGLAISKQLAERMGGQIGVNSQPGLGSTFWFTLRLRKATALAAPALAPTPPSAERQVQEHHAGAHILVAEDDVVNQEVTQGLLEEAAVVVHIAADGAKAVEMARRVNYDLILMDLQMPVTDGLEATRQIRSLPNNPNVPIIAMTANVFPEDEARCRGAGMDDFLARPVLPEVLFGTVLKWLERLQDVRQRV